MMASDTSLDHSRTEVTSVKKNATVKWKHRGTLVSVGVDAVSGCTEIERLSRIPGSQENVKGVISFKGEIVPLLSLFRERTSRLRRKEKTERYAIILSLGGAEFAVEVREIPSVNADPESSDSGDDRLCRIKQRHLERLARLLVSRGEVKTAGSEGRGRAGGDEGGGGRPGGTSENAGNDRENGPETTSMATYGCCAFEEGVTWKRH